MKKIVGIIAAVAMAASVFALSDANAELSATVRFGRASHEDMWNDASSGPYLFGFDGTDINLFNLKNSSDAVSLSVDLGVVGGSLGHDAAKPSIWFKPFWGDDTLKITLAADLGSAGNMLCGSPAEYYGIEAVKNFNKYGGYGGYQVESKLLDSKLVLGTVLMLGAASGSWPFWSKYGYETNLYVSYDDADSVGKIAGYMGAQNDFQTLRFGLGWTRGFGDDVKITPTLNVIGDAAAGNLTITLEPALAGAMDPVSWAVFVPVVLNTAGGAPTMSAVATVDLKIDEDGAFTKAWLKYGYKDILSGAIDMQFQVGCSGKITDNTTWEFRVEPTIAGSNFKIALGPSLIGNYGGMSWDLTAKFTIDPNAASPFSVIVPFSVSIGF